MIDSREEAEIASNILLGRPSTGLLCSPEQLLIENKSTASVRGGKALEQDRRPGEEEGTATPPLELRGP